MKIDYIIIPMPRAGSNCISDLITSAGICGRPRESWGDTIKNERVRDLYPEYSDKEAHNKFIENHCTKGGISAIKLQPKRILSGYREGVLNDLSPGHIFYLIRHPFDCAVSLHKARQTKKWIDYKKTVLNEDYPYNYPYKDFSPLVKEITKRFVKVRKIYKDIPFTVIYYENIQNSPEDTARKIINTVIDNSPDYTFDNQKYAIQRTSKEERYCNEFRHHFNKDYRRILRSLGEL